MNTFEKAIQTSQQTTKFHQEFIDKTHGKGFCLSGVLRVLKYGELFGFVDMYDCTPTGFTLIPFKHAVGNVKNGVFIKSYIHEDVKHLVKDWDSIPSTEFETCFVKESINGHTSFAKYLKKEMDEIKENFNKLFDYIIDNDLFDVCVLDIWNLKKLLTKDNQLRLMKDIVLGKCDKDNIFLLIGSKKNPNRELFQEYLNKVGKNAIPLDFYEQWKHAFENFY
jgi:hypothetical protein